MPIYEAYCAQCGEKFQDLARQPVQTLTCPICGLPAPIVPSVPAAPVYKGVDYQDRPKRKE